MIFEDEATFKLDPTLYQTWAPVGQRPIILSTGLRQPLHVFGGIAVEKGDFHYQFAPIMDAAHYTNFLEHLLRIYYPKKIIMPRDNAPWHRGPVVADFLQAHKGEIEPAVIPPYWPELNAQEYIWHFIRLFSTHNRFFANQDDLKLTLIRTFRKMQRNTELIKGYLNFFKIM